LDVGTAVATAFPRSPMVTAQIAWELAEASRGRFILGLGTQIKAHIERRFHHGFRKRRMGVDGLGDISAIQFSQWPDHYPCARSYQLNEANVPVSSPADGVGWPSALVPSQMKIYGMVT
jgi:hypothetical protein